MTQQQPKQEVIDQLARALLRLTQGHHTLGDDDRLSEARSLATLILQPQIAMEQRVTELEQQVARLTRQLTEHTGYIGRNMRGAGFGHDAVGTTVLAHLAGSPEPIRQKALEQLQRRQR